MFLIILIEFIRYNNPMLYIICKLNQAYVISASFELKIKQKTA